MQTPYSVPAMIGRGSENPVHVPLVHAPPPQLPTAGQAHDCLHCNTLFRLMQSNPLAQLLLVVQVAPSPPPLPGAEVQSVKKRSSPFDGI